MHHYMDHHIKEVIFIECNDKSCCSEFCFQAAKDFLGQDMRFPSPLQSVMYQGCWNTFLQETTNKNKHFGDAGKPSMEKAHGSCKIFPSFSFKSKTKRERHQSMFHCHQKLTSKEVQLIYCSLERCGRRFGTQSSLSRHQTNKKLWNSRECTSLWYQTC